MPFRCLLELTLPTAVLVSAGPAQAQTACGFGGRDCRILAAGALPDVGPGGMIWPSSTEVLVRRGEVLELNIDAYESRSGDFPCITSVHVGDDAAVNLFPNPSEFPGVELVENEELPQPGEPIIMGTLLPSSVPIPQNMFEGNNIFQPAALTISADWDTSSGAVCEPFAVDIKEACSDLIITTSPELVGAPGDVLQVAITIHSNTVPEGSPRDS